MSRSPIVLICATAAVLSAIAQQPAAPDMERIGPAVGEVAPDFELPDQHGVPRRLSSLVGANGAMLVFFRSADW